MDKGSIHIYCGEGKGKTTAAIILNIVLPKESKPVREMWELEDK